MSKDLQTFPVDIPLFHEELKTLTYKVTYFSMWFIAFFWIGWTLFDFLLLPEHYILPVVLRLIGFSVQLFLLVWVNRPRNQIHINKAFILFVAIMECFIAFMLPFAEQQLLAYIMGFGLSILISSVVIIWRPLFSYCLYGIAILSTIAAYFIFHPANFFSKHGLAGMIYLFSIIVLSAFTVNLRYFSALNEYIGRSKLEAAKQELEKVDDLKNEFIANITHDFRTPLMIIANSAELLLKNNYFKNEERKNAAYKSIYLSSLQLKSSTDKLLSVSRMDKQGIQLSINKLPLIAHLRNICEYYAASLYMQDITVDLICDQEEIADFYIDKEKFEQVMNNLLSNAIKFCDKDQGIIHIKVSDSPNSVLIAVEDNGIGISAVNISRLFTRFEQIESSRNKGYRGTGIGLAFSRQLVELMQGRIWAESAGEGRGTSFYMEFAKGQAHFKAPNVVFSEVEDVSGSMIENSEIACIVESELENKKGKQIARSFDERYVNEAFDYKKAKILLVDDIVQILEIEKSFLELAGYQNFILAHNGLQGIDAAYTYKPDIIICDYNMPELNGAKFHDEIVSNPELKNVPFVFVSAVVDKDVMLKRKSQGALAYLSKPIDEKEFISTVENHLKRHMEYLKTLSEASLDILTGINNRRSAFQEIKKGLSKRQLIPFSVIFVDIDHFKNINDQFGHSFGDDVLRCIGQTLKNGIREYDIIGRYGGEEFIIGLPETNKQDAVIVAEKLREAISQVSIPFNNQEIGITASFGVSSMLDDEPIICRRLGLQNLQDIFTPDSASIINWNDNLEIRNKIINQLVATADEALYRAKITRCVICGYQTAKEYMFSGKQCPQCKSTVLDIGRNRVVAYS